MSVGMEGSGPNPRTYSQAEYSALEAENARLERLVSHWQGLAVTNRKVADDALAQLAAIQGGMGVEMEVLAYRYTSAQRLGGKWHYQETFPKWDDRNVREIGQMQRLTDFDKAQRITAAMAAEVERLRDQTSAMSAALDRWPPIRDGLKLKLSAAEQRNVSLTAELNALRAELAEVKGREAVPAAYISAKSIERLSDPRIHGTASAIERKPTNGFVPLWLAPPASPDVEGLVKALERIADDYIPASQEEASIALEEMRNDLKLALAEVALSTWRQAQEKK